METLSTCPACGSDELRDVGLATNLTREDRQLIGPSVVWEADYASCTRCDLMFARNRQENSEIDDYYAAFPEIENRDYAVYPLPDLFLKSQNQFADRLVGNLAKAGLVRPEMSVLNVRCEYGVHLARLRDEHGVSELYGLDHFPTNIRHARENLGLENIEILDPYFADIPFGDKKFDLILANHQLTHALNPMAVLANLRSRVAPGGTVVFYNEIDHIPIMDLPKTFRRGVISYHKQLLTRVSLENICRLAGFKTDWLDYDPVGIKWASGRHSLTIAGSPAEAIDVSQVTPPAKPDLYDAYLEGSKRHGRFGLLHKARKLFASDQIPA
jgi:SAM-dependent methyltransferase